MALKTLKKRSKLNTNISRMSFGKSPSKSIKKDFQSNTPKPLFLDSFFCRFDKTKKLRKINFHFSV